MDGLFLNIHLWLASRCQKKRRLFYSSGELIDGSLSDAISSRVFIMGNCVVKLKDILSFRYLNNLTRHNDRRYEFCKIFLNKESILCKYVNPAV